MVIIYLLVLIHKICDDGRKDGNDNHRNKEIAPGKVCGWGEWGLIIRRKYDREGEKNKLTE